YIVNNGKILAEGTSEQILNNKKVRDVYLGKQFSL
ncbi:MAG: lipopolysaccharide ABC transporter ATP-binding protein, partial [Candidatus Marinimicrobia bacterium]|nr:lipopolysaccharide ABC transporter ATP-binding protein [Candidatus Neomarinimicrobiota bacterium]